MDRIDVLGAFSPVRFFEIGENCRQKSPTAVKQKLFKRMVKQVFIAPPGYIQTGWQNNCLLFYKSGRKKSVRQKSPAAVKWLQWMPPVSPTLFKVQLTTFFYAEQIF